MSQKCNGTVIAEQQERLSDLWPMRAGFAGKVTGWPPPLPDADRSSLDGARNDISSFGRAPNRQVFRGGITFFAMPRTTKPDPELLPIHRPRCPDCQMRMVTADVMPGPAGFEYRSYECPNCAHTETRIEDSDPLDVVRWIARETGPPLLRETGNGRDPRQQTNNPAPTK